MTQFEYYRVQIFAIITNKSKLVLTSSRAIVRAPEMASP